MGFGHFVCLKVKVHLSLEFVLEKKAPFPFNLLLDFDEVAFSI
jgi:hypothetical protein